jgi:spermidine synthase
VAEHGQIGRVHETCNTSSSVGPTGSPFGRRYCRRRAPEPNPEAAGVGTLGSASADSRRPTADYASTRMREGPPVSARFEELAWQDTRMGAISLRRRLDPALHVDVYEVKLGDEFLMSSLFTVAEIELARLGLAELTGTGFDVVVGGLGLGYTACAVVDDERVSSLLVVEALEEVIRWHDRRLLPDVARLGDDPRTRLQHGDFFAMAESAAGFDPDRPQRRFHAILLDVDHTPRHVLHPSHAEFYTRAGLRRLTRHLHPGGVFALWSDDPPDPDFLADLELVFDAACAHVIHFPNPITGGESANTVYTANP